jgi:hypothetical protein
MILPPQRKEGGGAAVGCGRARGLLRRRSAWRGAACERSRVRGGSRSALTGAACASPAPPRCRRRCRLHESGAVFMNPPSVDQVGNEVELRLVTSVASVPASGRGRGRNSRDTRYDLLAGRFRPPSRKALSSGGLELRRAGAPCSANRASALGAALPAPDLEDAPLPCRGPHLCLAAYRTSAPERSASRRGL